MHDLAARGSPLEYWFFRTEADDLRLLVDVIVRRDASTVETRVAITVGDMPAVSHDVQPMTTPIAVGVANATASIDPAGTSGDSGGVRWELDVDLGRHRIQPVSAPFAASRSLDMLLVSRPTAVFSGEVHAGGRRWNLDAAPGMVAHYWGRALAPSWCWVSVVGGPGEPRIEATLLRSRLWGSRATIGGGYVWAWSGLDADAPALFAMPTNGSWISSRRTTSTVAAHAQRAGRHLELTATAEMSSFVPFGDGIRNSQRATVRWQGGERSGSLEFRDPP